MEMVLMSRSVLAINSGSSSLKASLFRPDAARRDFRYEHIGQGFPCDHAEAFDALLKDLGEDVPGAIGHRFVHGGEVADLSRLLDADEITRLYSITHLAPLHMPGNLLGVELCNAHFDLPQVACFDTAFHQTMPELSRRLPIPQTFGSGSLVMRRYGFHGLNYAYVASQLPALLGDAAHGRVVVAHLGAGASLCLMEGLKSVDTTMGYTPAGGICMGTRSGDLDPGVMLELAKRLDHDELSDLVYHRMGLLRCRAVRAARWPACWQARPRPPGLRWIISAVRYVLQLVRSLPRLAVSMRWSSAAALVNMRRRYGSGSANRWLSSAWCLMPAPTRLTRPASIQALPSRSCVSPPMKRR